MAKTPQGILGPFYGKLGPAVGFSWKGRMCVRSYTPHIRDPRTPLQLEQRTRFTSMIRFAQQAVHAIRLGYKPLGMRLQITEGNCFTKRNTDLFGMADGRVVVDYSHIRLSEGALEPVAFATPHGEDGGRVRIAYDTSTEVRHTSPHDKVYLYAYCVDTAEGRLCGETQRADGEVTVELPATWDGAEVHLYGFCVGRKGEVSRTVYVGCVTGGEVTRTATMPATVVHAQSGLHQAIATDGKPTGTATDAAAQLTLWDIFAESIVAVDEEHAHETPPLRE